MEHEGGGGGAASGPFVGGFRFGQEGPRQSQDLGVRLVSESRGKEGQPALTTNL